MEGFIKLDGFTVKELIEALQKIPAQLQTNKVTISDGMIYRIEIWDDGVQLS